MANPPDDLRFYTYLWLREDGTPYYVGKGKNGRAFQRHRMGEAPAKDRVIIEYHESEDDALEAEKFLISFYGRKDLETGSLINLTDGGENPPVAVKGTGLGKKQKPETRVKHRIAWFNNEKSQKHWADLLKKQAEINFIAYARTFINPETRFEDCAKGGKIAGRKNAESGHMREIQKIGASLGGKVATHNKWHVNRGITNDNCNLCIEKVKDGERTFT